MMPAKWNCRWTCQSFPSASPYYVFHSSPWWAYFHCFWCRTAVKSASEGFLLVGYCSCLDRRWTVSSSYLTLFEAFAILDTPSLISFQVWCRGGELPRSLSENTWTLKIRCNQSFISPRCCPKTGWRILACQSWTRYSFPPPPPSLIFFWLISFYRFSNRLETWSIQQRTKTKS